MKTLLILLAITCLCRASIGEDYEALVKRYGLPKGVTAKTNYMIMEFETTGSKIGVFLHGGVSVREIYESKKAPFTAEEKSAFRDANSTGLRWKIIPSNQEGLRPYAKDGDKPYWLRADGEVVAICRSEMAFEVVRAPAQK